MGVLQYFAKRIAVYFAVLFIGLTITFFLPRLLPTNPIDAYIGQLQAQCQQASLTPEAIADLRVSLEELYGLKGNLISQYFSYLNHIVHFDFGPSFTFYPKSVSSLILTALPWTLTLLLLATVIAWVHRQRRRRRGRLFPHAQSGYDPRSGRHPALSNSVLHPGRQHHSAARLCVPDFPAFADISGGGPYVREGSARSSTTRRCPR